MTVQLAWGPGGAELLGTTCDVVVVCDVLSFSTAVSVAVARGVGVWPHRWRDESASARAEEIGAALAGDRDERVSLSPVALAALPAEITEVMLPSPNGATCCLAAAAGDATVVAGCLRNAPAVASWLSRQNGDVGLVAAGEQWADGSLRPSYEDWVGAGAIASLLRDRVLSREAAAAAAADVERRPLLEVLSGRELADRGFAADVTMAADYGADDVVPLLVDGRFGPAPAG